MLMVTISGADDFTDPKSMVQLSHVFPFVEWGILWSTSRKGQPRYPSIGWIMDLMVEKGLALSLHYCGLAAEDVVQGIDDPPKNFQRIQINGFDPQKSRKMPRFHQEVILQANYDGILDVAQFIRQRPEDRLSMLVDGSGGQSIFDSSWPAPPTGIKFGYAGGIGPHNLSEVFSRIVGRDVGWIDMESHVRTYDRLDMDKVHTVLEAVLRFNQATSG